MLEDIFTDWSWYPPVYWTSFNALHSPPVYRTEIMQGENCIMITTVLYFRPGVSLDGATLEQLYLPKDYWRITIKDMYSYYIQ